MGAASSRARNIILLCSLGIACSAGPAHAADVLVPESRTLFLTERFTPSSMRAPLTSGVQPHQLVALRGEREGFQLAVRNPTAGTLSLSARVVPAASLAGEQATGRIGIELLRVGMVRLPRGSTGMSTSGGSYADPLPRFGIGTAGRLNVAAGSWGGVVLLARVRTDATAGTHTGVLELVDPVGNVRARQSFALDVRARTLKQSGSAGSFTTVMNVESAAYWMQHKALRNDHPDRMAQVTGLMSFLDTRDITPLSTPFASPADSGRYTCSYDSPGSVARFSYRSQLASRYFGRTRDIDPGARQFPVRVLPTHTSGCNPDRTTDDFKATTDPRRTPGVKQDDSLHGGARIFFARVASAWRSGSWFGRRTYAFNPFDEPGDATAAQRATMNRQVPAANVALRRAVRGSAKVVLTSWPRDSRNRRICRRYGSGQRCTTMSGDAHSNRRMWDGRGADDVDVWVAPFSRLFGRTTPRTLRAYGAAARRDREYANRLAAIRRAKRGRETWAYNFFTATRTMPQLSIDAPGTDARLQYWLLARDGHTGLFVSNLMMGWGGVQTLPNGLRRKGNPYDEALYFQHRQYGYAAGWGTFIYPGYRPELGLVQESSRNTEQARPVTSLRLEGMRDGQEDANMVAMYRARFGSGSTGRQLQRIFPGSSRTLPRSLGNVVMPTWSNRNLAQRMEAQRRTMIDRLSR